MRTFFVLLQHTNIHGVEFKNDSFVVKHTMVDTPSI